MKPYFEDEFVAIYHVPVRIELESIEDSIKRVREYFGQPDALRAPVPEETT